MQLAAVVGKRTGAAGRPDCGTQTQRGIERMTQVWRVSSFTLPLNQKVLQGGLSTRYAGHRLSDPHPRFFPGQSGSGVARCGGGVILASRPHQYGLSLPTSVRQCLAVLARAKDSIRDSALWCLQGEGGIGHLKKSVKGQCPVMPARAGYERNGALWCIVVHVRRGRRSAPVGHRAIAATPV
jgi:hypothetical protein